MNEAFESQICSCCLKPQITTTTGFIEKNISVILWFPLLQLGLGLGFVRVKY